MTVRHLTPHFALEEFLVSDAAERLGVDNEPTPEHLENLKALADLMEEVRALFNSSIVIFSGYRNPVVNAAVGGVPNSDHALGRACDFRVAGLTPVEAGRIIAASKLKFDQLINESSRGILHIGIGIRMRRQVLRQPGGPGTAVMNGLE